MSGVQDATAGTDVCVDVQLEDKRAAGKVDLGWSVLVARFSLESRMKEKYKQI